MELKKCYDFCDKDYTPYMNKLIYKITKQKSKKSDINT